MSNIIRGFIGATGIWVVYKIGLAIGKKNGQIDGYREGYKVGNIRGFNDGYEVGKNHGLLIGGSKDVLECVNIMNNSKNLKNLYSKEED